MKTTFKTKNLIITFFLFTFLSGAKILAQGNLQFNQVITKNLSTPYIVPVGKVFKLEAVCASNPGYLISIGPHTMNLHQPLMIGIINSASESFAWPLPIWLKAGDIISYGGTSGASISGIEFNVVP